MKKGREKARSRARRQVLLGIGRNIRTHRQACGMSQRELGERIGRSPQKVSYYENGRTSISAYTLWAIAGALAVSIKEFYP
jgi:transcriptional regulator with XRE-family HTH domain